ncbi:MAG TPA: Ig-like domain-containing protein [Bacilli bacterium]|nr:Ig-like domain-containing protein [Bacilli bacterium]
MKMRKIKSLFFLTLFSVIFAQTRAPIAAKANVTILTTESSESYINNYYSTISESLTGNSLASALETRLKAERGRTFAYTSMQTTAFPYIDVDPLRPYDGYIVSFYSGTPVKGYVGMNREHTWPNSHGGGKVDNDPHMVRPTLTSENSARENAYFSDNPQDGWDPAEFSNPKYRGISARIIFYSAVIGKSQGLTIEDKGFVSGTGNGGQMGKLSDLLRWNFEYPVDQTEIIRNETLDKSLDYNRNPFIDRPDYACKIWGDTNATTRNICDAYNPAEVASVTVPTTNLTVQVNETVSVNASVLPSNAPQGLSYVSSNTNVATVNASGVVTGKAVGTSTVTVTSTSDTTKKAYVTINVTNDPIAVTGLEFETSDLLLLKGTTENSAGSVIPSNATNKVISYLSSDPHVFTVNSSGLLTAHNAGKAVLTAITSEGNFTKSRLINVVTSLPETSVTANYGHSASDNNGGKLNNSPTNFINNGEGSIRGFGESVVSSATATNVYLPRGSGIAIGTSSGAGTLRLNFKSEYYTNKIKLTFNLSGQGDTLTSIKGSSNETVLQGTFGTQYSFPSDGTPFEVTFSAPTTYIEIKTSKRLVLQAIELFYGEVSNEVTNEERATNWAMLFLANTSNGCALSDASNLTNVWPDEVTRYNALNGAVKSVITSSTPNAEGSSVSHALARYKLIVNKYGLEHFISGLDVSSQQLTSDGANIEYFIYLAPLITIITFIYILIKKTRPEV